MAKGSMIDLIIVLIFVIIISIIVLISYSMMGQLLTGFQATGITTTQGLTSAQAGVHVWNEGFIFFIVFLGIISIGSALMIRSHPIFFVISLIILVIIGVLAPSFSNVYDAFATGVDSTTDSAFSSMGFIMRNVSLFFLIIGSLTAIVMYSKTRESAL